MPRHGPRRPDRLEKAERRLHAQRRFSRGCQTPTARQGATHAHTVPAAEARLTEETPHRVLAERDGRTCGASRAGEGVAQAQLDSYAERCGRERRRAPSWRYCAASCGERRSARRLSRRPVRWVDAVRDGARGPGALRSPRARGSRREPAAYRRSSAARPSRSRCAAVARGLLAPPGCLSPFPPRPLPSPCFGEAGLAPCRAGSRTRPCGSLLGRQPAALSCGLPAGGICFPSGRALRWLRAELRLCGAGIGAASGLLACGGHPHLASRRETGVRQPVASASARL